MSLYLLTLNISEKETFSNSGENVQIQPQRKIDNFLLLTSRNVEKRPCINSAVRERFKERKKSVNFLHFHILLLCGGL